MYFLYKNTMKKREQKNCVNCREFKIPGVFIEGTPFCTKCSNIAIDIVINRNNERNNNNNNLLSKRN